jgi:transcriptional regulator with XRE-family HTH domain
MLKKQIRSDVDVLLPRRLLALRHARSLTIAELSLASGVSKAMISKIERSESSPTAAILGKLASALGISLAQLLTQDDDSGSRIRRRDEQDLWRDPESGYRRRQVAKRDALTGIEIVEVELPRSARIAYPRWNSQPYRQRLWVINGRLRVDYGKESFELREGDYLDFGVDRPVSFASLGKDLCRYLLVISVK